ncbi:MAG: ABC transporter substrate-binding protein, partial [Deltaproteobacteria bacterium]|nr:ABC transporter substrate-binding protein [Deltaproteobacteria bacterium]
MGTSLWQSPELIKLARDYVQGAVFPSGFFEKSREPGVRAFVTAYEADFGSAPGMLAAVGYDTIRLLNEILQREDIQTRKGVRNELFRVQDYKGVTGDIQFDEQGELIKEPLLLTVSGRRMKLVSSIVD